MIEENGIAMISPKSIPLNSPSAEIPQYVPSQKRQNPFQDIDTEEEKGIGLFNGFQDSPIPFIAPYSSSSNSGQNIWEPQSISPPPSSTFPSRNVLPNTTSQLNVNRSFSTGSQVPTQNFTFSENFDLMDP